MHIASPSPTPVPMGTSAQLMAASPTPPPTLPASGFIRQRLLLQCIPFSKSTLWRRVKAGAFPAPLRLSEGITAWRAEEVHRWIAERG
ncbi:helix-turn-helix transcriptional regulator [Paracidovorax anthurii]|uniref:AlpA family transcriptional regulator n=1 Tax=Paracidovorax anthurii TaxID=78229 RepID=A0A328Z120_9BURK|nr:AlpA family phage regulatory protein [Paracidovorax anthurii]RAR78182.1 AlpA family transcriptional regulator [Paracidovorax anthurii]